jgi:hypothetical protein
VDVEQEMRAALRRVNGNTYKRVLEARGRIYQPTPTERAEIDAGLRDSPVVEAMKKIGQTFDALSTGARAFVDAFNKALK